MKSRLALLVLLLTTVLAASVTPANANMCSQIAANEAASRGAVVLSVRATRQGGGVVCEIKLRIPGKAGQPPRVETVRRNG